MADLICHCKVYEFLISILSKFIIVFAVFLRHPVQQLSQFVRRLCCCTTTFECVLNYYAEKQWIIQLCWFLCLACDL